MGAFIAREDIPWGGVLAYARGQRVEAEAVEQHGLQDYVVGENTKEGRQIKADVSGQPIESFETTTTRSRATSTTSSDSATAEQKG